MNGRNCGGVHRPHVDETPVPCPNGYHSTSCIYVDDNVDTRGLGLEQKVSLSELLNSMICTIKKQSEIINELKNK